MSFLVAAALPVLGVAVAAGAALQPAPFSWTHESISAAAALDASYRWVTTAAMVGAGIVHFAAAVFLAGAASVGRALLAATGLFLLLIAAFPLPAGGGWSITHAFFAGLAGITMTLWPVAAVSAGALRAPVRLTMTVLILVLCCWYVLELVFGGSRDGAAERAAIAVEVTWLAVTVRAEISGRRHASRASLRLAETDPGPRRPAHGAAGVDVVPISR